MSTMPDEILPAAADNRKKIAEVEAEKAAAEYLRKEAAAEAEKKAGQFSFYGDCHRFRSL